MSPLTFRSPRAAFSAASFAAVSVYCLRGLYIHFSDLMQGDCKSLCGDTKWEVSLGNDCFRLGFLWPALLQMFGGISALVFCLCYLLPFPNDANGFTSDGSSPLSRLSVGNKLIPVRRPPGQTIIVDNRIRLGMCTVLLLTVQVALYSVWASASNNSGLKDHLYSSAMCQLSAVTLVLSVVCLVMLCRSNRMTYAGLFPSLLPIAVGLQFLSGLCEIHASFFTDDNANIPVIGTNASVRSNILVLTTLFNLGLLVLFSLIQCRPIVYRPLSSSPDNTMDSSYTVLAETGDDALDDEATPLAHMSDQKANELVDTPEQNSSWFDKLTFSWPNELFVRGAKGCVDHSDLYLLGEKDMPIPNWKRYNHRQKPGRSLLVTLLLTYAPELLIQFALGLALTISRFAGPFFFQHILRSIELSQEGLVTSNTRSKYLNVFGLLFSTLLTMLLGNWSIWIECQIGIRLKGFLVAKLTTKTLCRRGKGSTDEEKKKDNNKRGMKEDSASTDGKVMNILTDDFERIVSFVSKMDSLYLLPIQIVFGVYYMYTMLGISALIGLLVTILYIPLSKALFARLRKIKEQQSAASDKRIAKITEVLQGIKAIKLFGWESRFLESIEECREQQLDYAWKAFLWGSTINASAWLNPVLILVMMFTSYVVVFGNTLNAEVAFTSTSIFNIVHFAIRSLPDSISSSIVSYVALKRVDSYLKQPQVQALEERTPAQTVGNELGFDCADLEWNSANNTKDMPSTTVGDSTAPTRANTNSDGQSAEDSPLLAGASQSQTTLSVRSSTTRIIDQDDIPRFSLKDINVQFPIGALSIIAGPTGSGKSSLLSALVGEMMLVRGRVLLPTIDPNMLADNNEKYRDVIELSNEGLGIRDIAYVSQEAWLRNATIRENILFGEAYSRERYEEVLRVCALKPDLRILPAGDMSEIGERGITLSGGQKQRVALARAVYSSCRILLIDDCLSAVDAHTAKHILIECLSSESALMRGRTRVLVTHHVTMCIPYAQYMVMIHEGRITLKGSPDEFKSKSSLLLALLESQRAKDNQSTEQDKESDKKNTHNVNDKKSEDEYNREHLMKLAEQKGIDPNSDLSVLQGVLIKDEEREVGYVKFEVWKTFMFACGSKVFWGYIIAVLVTVEAIAALRKYWLKLWVESAGESSPGFSILPSSLLASASANAPILTSEYASWPLKLILHVSSLYRGKIKSSNAISSHHSSIYWIGVYTLLCLIIIAWSVLRWYLTFTGKLRVSRKMHSQLARKVVHAVPRFYDSTPAGRIINRFSRDMATIDGGALDSVVAWFGGIIYVLVVFVIVAAALPAFSISAIAATGMFLIIAFYYLNTSRELNRLESNSMSPLLSLFSELIQGTTTIRAFGVKHYYIQEAINRISAYNRPYYALLSANRWLSVRIESTGAVVSATAALFVLFNLEWIDAGMAGFILSYATLFAVDMLWVVRDYGSNEMNMNSIERILQYLRVEQEAALESDPENKPPAVWPRKGNVQIEDLVVEYTPGVPVLHGISLSVKHGERIGIVGRTGAGKSSMSLAMLRYLEASKGRVVLDGVDISKIGLEDLRRNVTIIPQDPVLFNGTIRFNLDPFDEHPDELLWDALRRTHLIRESGSQTNSSTASVAEGDNDKTPMLERMAGIFTSLDAEIKENGQNLSQGQRQLVSLARALVRRSRLIIMDEATASVDFDTDERIQRTIRGPEFANSTLFCIAHRLRTIIDYDRVLVLENGKVAEFDTPHNLLQNENGIFRSMCEKAGEFKHLLSATTSGC